MVDDGESDSYVRAWIWGISSVTIVSLCSLGGAAILPLLTGKSKSRWMHMFIAMAVATLSTDAILHLIPQVLGIHGSSHEHSHTHKDEEEEHGHGHHHHHNESSHEADEHVHAEMEHSHEDDDEIWSERAKLIKMSVVCAVVFVLYFFEFIAHCRRKETKKVFDSESSGSTSQVAWEDQKGIVNRSVSSNGAEAIVSTPADDEEERTKMCGLTSAAMVIIFGDAVHNFIDGVAIGVSFMVSTRLGISTSIAVVAHELPHELGDLAVLLHSGLSVIRALLFNLFSALTAYAGLALGIAAGKIETAEKWLLAITAGMFLYVAWVDMMTHLKHSARKTDDPWWLLGLFQLFGFVFGFALIFLVGWFEHSF